jgi:hypothetical protein
MATLIERAEQPRGGAMMSRPSICRRPAGALFAIAFAIVLSAAASAGDGQRPDGAPRQQGDPELAGFSVTVERTSKAIRFGCTAGCVWKQVEAPCGDATTCAASVSDDGLVVPEAPPQDVRDPGDHHAG